MEGIPNRQEGLDTLRPEHLAEGFRPITACVGTIKEHAEKISAIEDIENTGLNVDYFWNKETSGNNNLKNAGERTYVISPVDERSKFTETLRECTSLIAVGRGTEGTELSFLTHQDPHEFLSWKLGKFTDHLKESLEELKKRCVAGSIDVVIAGGVIIDKNHDYLVNYQKSLEILSGAVQESLGFVPTVVSGPKSGGDDDIYFDTQNRRLLIVRQLRALLHKEPFKAETGAIEKMKGKWRKEQKEREQ